MSEKTRTGTQLCYFRIWSHKCPTCACPFCMRDLSPDYWAFPPDMDLPQIITGHAAVTMVTELKSIFKGLKQHDKVICQL